MIFRSLVRASLLGGTSLIAGQSLHAQTSAPDRAQASVGQDGADIVVTGSRIARPDYAAPTPLTSFGAAKIQQSGNTNVTEFLRRVPALTNSLDSTRTAGNAQADGALGQAGLNLLDLRGLGTNRTLVLVDGRRHVASQFDTAAVDINAIPTDLIERVDVLTGAASAIYGADAVSGVVNFVLRRDFDGLAARVQSGISSRGDAANHFASLIAGRNFLDGRANVTLAYEYNAEQPLANDDRAYLRSANRINFVNADDYVAGQAGSYQKVPVADIRYPGGYFDGTTTQPGGSYRGIVKIGDRFYRGDGQPYVFGRVLQNDAYSLGGDDSPVAGYIGDILPRTRRHAGNLLARFAASDSFKLSVEGKFVQTTATTFTSYSGSYPTSATLDNPFIPANLIAAARAAGLTSVDVYRNNFDFPRRGEEDRRRTYRGVVDASGTLNEHAAYDISYTYGRTDVRATKLNDRLATRFVEALDAVRDPATGRAICRSAAAQAAGCLPVNVFGERTADPLAFPYFLSNPASNARIQQHVANATLTGDFGQFFQLPGGPVQFAVGGEYRREQSRFRPTADLVNGVFFQYDEPVAPVASAGRFHVWEVFGELNAPLLKDQPFAHLLSVGAAGRFSDYSTVGSTRAYQFNGVYAPVEAISFRGSYGRSVRAPNIAEIFRPRTGTTDFVTDACYLGNRGQGTQFREANCAALITATGGNPATFTSNNNPDASVSLLGAQQGNPGLRAEVARTWTAGAVLRPGFVPRLQVALDWYDIRLKGAINQTNASTIAALCVDQPTTDNPFCRSITRRQGTGYISGYVLQPENVAAFHTAGLELNSTYQAPMTRFGQGDIRLVGGYLHRLEQVATPGAAVENQVDQPFRPKYNLTISPTWTLDGVTLAYNLRWQNGVYRFSRVETSGRLDYVEPRYARFKELWQHDVQIQFAAVGGFQVYAGVNNLTDQKPDIGFQTNVPISPVGRYFYAGAKLSL